MASTIDSQLNALGCCAVNLDGEEFADIDADLSKLLACADNDFQTNFLSALNAETAPNFKKVEQRPQWQRGRDAWKALHHSRRDAIRQRLDLKTDIGQRRVHVAKVRVNFANSITQGHVDPPNTIDDLNFYLAERVQFVKQGNSRMALGNTNAWTNAGFGKWPHIVSSLGVRSALALRRLFLSQGMPVELSSLPHFIIKPPGGGRLDAHTDGAPPARMIEWLDEKRVTGDLHTMTVTEYGEHWGYQQLVHYKGGRVDGYTFALGPLDPFGLWICLTGIRSRLLGLSDERLVGTGRTIEQWAANPSGGPAWLKWDCPIVLDALNRRLAEFGKPPMRMIPIRPDADLNCPFVAKWPRGFPHGSAANTEIRVSTTSGIRVESNPDDPRDERVPVHITALAGLAASDSSTHSRAQSEATIAGHKRPFAGGSTHAHPERRAKWYRHGSGFYAPIAPTAEEAREYAAQWHADGGGAQGA